MGEGEDLEEPRGRKEAKNLWARKEFGIFRKQNKTKPRLHGGPATTYL